ncbi:hypothetical protein [Pseudomonas fragi]|uniref:hypothetical protein n=1 Tax=Pseudomonas fragi TaxID=296 RepID=UPI00211B9807|nr:hypothetical protein [Pseudomonas fragi]
MSNLLSRLRSASMVIPAALVLAACQQPVKPVAINIAAINDFHGNLAATPFTYTDATAPAGKVSLKAGVSTP